MRFLMYLALTISAGMSAHPAWAAKKSFSEVSVHALSLAPNAGGQEAYRLEGYQKPHAWHAFYNRALMVYDLPLMGVGYNYRMSICNESCFWRFFTQAGGGISNAGPYGEISWGTIIPMLPLWLPTSAPRYIPSLRIDITSQFYIAKTRIITWSYPIWAGVSLAF
jgi:hypothetical protein